MREQDVMIPVSEESLKLRWLVGARWWACLGLCLAFVVGRWGLGFTLDAEPFAAVLWILTASNIASYFLQRPPSERLLSATIILDVVLFTALLYFYGGSTNPLCSVYFLYVILASILLPPFWGWATATLCSICFGLLFFFFLPIPELAGGHAHHHPDGFSTHLQGMLITFAFTAFVIVYFISRLTAALRTREHTLEALREKNRHTERLAALTTLAAGAAHELRNPLATISLAIGELSRELKTAPSNPELLVEAESIQQAVNQCQKIIDGLCGNAGIVSGEPLVTTSAESVICQLLEHLPNPELCQVRITQEAANAPLQTFSSSLIQALLSLLRNGLEYGPVQIEVQRNDTTINFSIRDSGPGIPPEALSRLGDPFFTTKGTGKGMGLGLFITKTFAERIGGSLSFDSTLNKGTVATLAIPCAL